MGSIYLESFIQNVSEINPHGLLFIFLPVLVFEGAYTLDCHIFLKELPQIIILAGPCVIFNAFLMMFAIKLIIYPDYVKKFYLGCL